MDDKFLEHVPMKIENICDRDYDVDEFDKGVGVASYYAGIYVGLINAGIEIEDAVEILKLYVKEEEVKQVSECQKQK